MHRLGYIGSCSMDSPPHLLRESDWFSWDYCNDRWVGIRDLGSRDASVHPESFWSVCQHYLHGKEQTFPIIHFKKYLLVRMNENSHRHPRCGMNDPVIRRRGAPGPGSCSLCLSSRGLSACFRRSVPFRHQKCLQQSQTTSPRTPGQEGARVGLPWLPAEATPTGLAEVLGWTPRQSP